MSRRNLPVLALISLLCLSACGYRGALYMPEEPSENTSEPADNSATEQE